MAPDTDFGSIRDLDTRRVKKTFVTNESEKKMNLVKKLAILSLCPLYIGNSCVAEAMEDWCKQTWKRTKRDFFRIEIQHGSEESPQSEEISLEENNSINTFNFNDLSYGWQPETIPASTKLNSEYISFHPQQEISLFPIETKLQTSNDFYFQHFQPIDIITIPIPRPPLRTHFITKDEVATMKMDKARINELLNLIYWDIIQNCLTLEEIKNIKNINCILKTTPNHQLWNIIHKLNAFYHFPGLPDIIKNYADEGLATAQLALGFMYEQGRGVQKDIQKGMDYLHLSANQGLSKSQTHLANKYCQQKIMTENIAEAVRLYTFAANQGFAQAKGNLGGCYMLGHGVEKSEDQALKYYFEANLENFKDHITSFLTPVSTCSSKDSFSEKNFFTDIEKELGILVSMHYPEALSNRDQSALQKIQKSTLMEYHSWIYNALVEEAYPLVETLKTIPAGFLINCLQIKEGVIISEAKNNPAPTFFHRISMDKSQKNYITLGEDNVITALDYTKVINFFHKDVKNKLNEMVGVNSLKDNIKDKEKSHRKLENKLLLAKLFPDFVTEDEKNLHSQKIIDIQCKLDIINIVIAGLRKKSQKAISIVQKELKTFKKVADLFSDYVEKGAQSRNELFLKNYPYLRAKG